MVERSVPYYDEIQRMTCEMAADFAVPGSNIYDFGCATGTTLYALHDSVPEDVRLVGIDNSDEMLARAKEKLAALPGNRVTELVNADINEQPAVENASACVMLLTLQFIRPLNREAVMRRIFAGMKEHGCLIVVEKLVSPHSLINRQFIKYYYALKARQGYSEMEISQKREALENVLVPYRLEENFELLRRTGFTQVDEFFRWYNFCGIVAIK